MLRRRYFMGVTLIPYLAGFITGAIGWKLGARVDLGVAIIAAMVTSSLGYYYARRYLKKIRQDMGL